MPAIYTQILLFRQKVFDAKNQPNTSVTSTT